MIKGSTLKEANRRENPEGKKSVIVTTDEESEKSKVKNLTAQKTPAKLSLFHGWPFCAIDEMNEVKNLLYRFGDFYDHRELDSRFYMTNSCPLAHKSSLY